MPDDRLKLTLSYDGTEYCGWARQPGRRSVEGVLTAALGELFDSVADLAVAGRTDAGVHAVANVVSVAVTGGPPPERAAEALNAHLPDDVAVTRADPVPAGFNARFSAKSRSYRYRLWQSRTRSPLEAKRAFWHPRTVDVEQLNRSAALLLGKHDFRSFTPAETLHQVFVRTILEASWHERGELLEFEVTADSFLRHMVRTLVGTMLARSPDEIVELLTGAPRASAGPTAPPWGLYLTEVRY